jgi:hypothetical protein
MPTPLRLIVYDPTDTRPLTSWLTSRLSPTPNPDGTSSASPGLSPIWYAGTLLHRLTGAADATLGARTWPEALTWATRISQERGRPIASLQAWGHGGWGFMLLGKTRLDSDSLHPEHAFAPLLDAFRARLSGPEAVVWLRCCSAFGATPGRRFAVAAARRLGCRVAGHTYIIGLFQSGTHSVRPGQEPAWDPAEGVNRDAAGRAISAKWSGPFEPATVSCLRLGLPDDA